MCQCSGSGIQDKSLIMYIYCFTLSLREKLSSKVAIVLYVSDGEVISYKCINNFRGGNIYPVGQWRFPDAKVKSGYDKVGRRRGLTEADVEVLKKSTVNLAPQDWEKRILNDSLTSEVQHRMKIAVMRDYLCPEGAR